MPPLPTDLLRTQAIRHGAQLWCWRFEVCHTNLQEPHIFLFRVTWKDKREGSTAKVGVAPPAQAPGDENQRAPNQTWEQLPLRQVGSAPAPTPRLPMVLGCSLRAFGSGSRRESWRMRKQHPTGPLSRPRPAHSACPSLAWASHSRPHHWALKIVFIWMPRGRGRRKYSPRRINSSALLFHF